MVNKTHSIKLSICIATYTRGKFIGETLDSILSQMQPGVELIVVDGASPDNTPEVMAQYLSHYPEIRYYREQENSGVDRDYDKAVGYATGEYCWLMTDDDLLHPGAIKTVLSELDGMNELVVVNAEFRNVDFSKVLDERLLKLKTDKKYHIGDKENIFSEIAQGLSFIGCVVIKHNLWSARNRFPYFGSLFVHVGVIFQQPALEKVMVIAQPLIIIRYGNSMWTPRGFEIWMVKWPELIWSFSELSDSAKSTVCPRGIWKNVRKLFFYRAVGGYSVNEYRVFLFPRYSGLERSLYMAITIIPPVVANIIGSLYCAATTKNARMIMYGLVHSRHATWISRWVARNLDV